MATHIGPVEPGRQDGLTARQRELLKSARVQLGAIVSGPEGVLDSRSELYKKVLELMGEIEHMLGY